jgi:hypothetical protein
LLAVMKFYFHSSMGWPFSVLIHCPSSKYSIPCFFRPRLSTVVGFLISHQPLLCPLPWPFMALLVVPYLICPRTMWVNSGFARSLTDKAWEKFKWNLKCG